jgi:hypothetical protein
MSNSLNDNIEPDDGLDYIFGRMGAIYGSAFNRHWDGIDPNLVRQEWKGQLGDFLTHKPSLDYAIARLDGNFPPSAIKFREFCNSGPHIPIDKPMIEFNPKPFVPMPDDIKQKLAQLRGKN